MANYDENKALKLDALKAMAQQAEERFSTKTDVTKLTARVGTLESAKDTYATKEEVKAQVGSAYKAKGSTTYEQLPDASADTVGDVYNITAEFRTSDDKFVEGNDKTYPAGTNVVVVQVESEYKYDVLSGMVDLTEYAKNSDLADLVSETELTGQLADYLKSSTADSTYVKQSGSKQLSDENFTADYKTKLDELDYATTEEVQAMLAEVFADAE